jgi:hypothetical protein
MDTTPASQKAELVIVITGASLVKSNFRSTQIPSNAAIPIIVIVDTISTIRRALHLLNNASRRDQIPLPMIAFCKRLQFVKQQESRYVTLSGNVIISSSDR